MSRSKIFIFLIILSEILIVVFFPYALVIGRQTVPFPFLRAEYSYTVNILGYGSVQGQLVLSTADIINATYIKVTETIRTGGIASTSMTFYVSLINRSAIFAEELLPTPEIPPHGEYLDLWIGEGHAVGESLKILNGTVTLAGSGLRCYGWMFFNTLAAHDVEFNCSQNVTLYGSVIPADYYGRLEIIYDRETGLMLEDRQCWTVNYVESGSPKTLSYNVIFIYSTSNVRFTYFTYALTVGVYSAIILVVAALVYLAVHVYRKKKAERLALEKPPTIGEEPSAPPPPAPPTDTQFFQF
ncbi:MAG: hypothetical protein QHH18_05485 [Candidatus Bathyarchaeota archaeon]|jgi:hypothetical protein|nr:hypothetical protein [Candidatus Bathyarchaeota archaeon A05DMB-5]MDH7558041.1 hypothetical protein [Candidatus Bathyarchaeota archaeon]